MTDVLIIGGGSAGCVLAARLSEDASLTVTLVEAGQDLSQTACPPVIRSRYPGKPFLMPEYTWPGLQAKMSVEGSLRRYEQARVLGGGSAINALAANRGAPEDYDAWGRLGAQGWSWESVLPYFRKLESDLNFAGDTALHGADGPLPIGRFPRESWSPFGRTVGEILERRGLTYGPDQNGVWGNGFYPMTLSMDAAGQRQPTSLAYLTPAVRARRNLTILTGATATRVLFEGKRAVGAAFAPGPGVPPMLRAGTVFVCAGALHTPALLMRSGIGSAAAAKVAGVPLVHSLPGVGRNLMEHPSLSLAAYLKPHARWTDARRHHGQSAVRFSSGLPGCQESDLFITVIAKPAWHGVGRRLGSLFFWVNQSYSRGVVTLNPAAPGGAPVVDFRLLEDERDLIRLRTAFRMAAEILLDPQMADVATHVFPAHFSDRVRKVTRPTRWNAIQTGLLGGMLDALPMLRGALIRGLITRGVSLASLLADDAALDAFLRREAGGVWHVCGTCRMGREDDPAAVTDKEGRVLGVEGLRICDASLMPSIPSANTNLPTIMLAEKIADHVRAAHGRGAC